MIIHLAKKCQKKIVGPVFLRIFVKINDPVNVTGVMLTFFVVVFMTFLGIIIYEGSYFMNLLRSFFYKSNLKLRVMILVCHLRFSFSM